MILARDSIIVQLSYVNLFPHKGVLLEISVKNSCLLAIKTPGVNRNVKRRGTVNNNFQQKRR